MTWKFEFIAEMKKSQSENEERDKKYSLDIDLLLN